MSHAREQIRKAAVNILDGASAWKAVIGTRVAPTRLVWPFLLVFSDGEPATRLQVHQTSNIERLLSLNIVAYVHVSTNKENVEDSMDDIAAEIESRMTTSALMAQLPGKNVSLSLAGNSFVIIVDEEDTISHAEVVMNYVVRYFTNEGAPSALL